MLVASWNIACSGRDEQYTPLSERLDAICAQLVEAEIAGVRIVCIQEIRKTGSLSVPDVIAQLQTALSLRGNAWEFVDAKVNSSAGAFHRTTFFHPSLSVRKTEVFETANTRDPRFGYMAHKIWFCETDSTNILADFAVINAHSPLVMVDKMAYWNTVFRACTGRCVVVGDLNKFTEDTLSFVRMMHTNKVRDLVVDAECPITFASFMPHDADPTGKQWRSSLDAIVTPLPSTSTSSTSTSSTSTSSTTSSISSPWSASDLKIISTDETRASDHFMLLFMLHV